MQVNSVYEKSYISYIMQLKSNLNHHVLSPQYLIRVENL